MKKYLREMEVAGILLLAIGVVLSLFFTPRYGAWPCAVGILLFLATMVYKAFHWQEYEKENKRNIVIILFTILLLLFQMMKQ